MLHRLAGILALATAVTLTVSPGSAAPAAPPALQVTTLVGGVDIPWDVQPIDNGRLLITERSKRRLLLWSPSGLRRVKFPGRSVWAKAETGLMSLAVDPDYASNHRIYTCAGNKKKRGHDIRVRAWRLKLGPARVQAVRTLVRGIPASSSGIHGGCRLLITRDGSLLVGTGDATVGTNPRDLGSLAGKTLRINRFTGAAWPTNPFVGSANANTRRILTFGHRNVQGLAERADGTLWSAEHGPDRDDEINLLQPGGDYGWNPVPGYNQTVPMTDQDLPGAQVAARWSSGFPTIATSGARFVAGSQWGSLEGTLAVGTLKGSKLMFLQFDSEGIFQGIVKELGGFGRLRSVTQLADGSLLVTTSNGGGRDRVLQVRPTPAG